MSVVDYKLRDEVKQLIVCLYNPSDSSEETQYTFSTLWDYVLDCGWQLEQGERIKRFPYKISPCLADAERSQREFKQSISSFRKQKATGDGDTVTNQGNKTTPRGYWVWPAGHGNPSEHPQKQKRTLPDE